MTDESGFDDGQPAEFEPDTTPQDMSMSDEGFAVDVDAETVAHGAGLEDETLEDPANEDLDESDGHDDVIQGRGLVDEDTLSQLLADADPEMRNVTDEVPEIAENLDVDMSDDLAEAEDAPESLFADLDDALDADADAPLVLGEEARVAEDDDDVRADTAAARPLNARVVKMKRTEFEAAIAQGVIEEDHDGSLGEAALSPEEEEDLLRELAEVEAELDGHEVDADAAQPDTNDVDDAFEDRTDAAIQEMTETADVVEDAEFVDVARDAPGETGAADADDAPEGDDLRGAVSSDAAEAEADKAAAKPRRGLSRLLGMGKREPVDEERIFDEADSQMGDKDVSMRRTAIQHLRAAVAATRAEKKAGVDVDQSVDETPYRSDLAEVVRPRRPSAAAPTTRSARPADQRPAPLKLVAEQRVDTERAPVRPRRVSAAEMAEAASTAEDGFTAFAEEMGATELSDLLEAAAAYMSDVEGRTEFSRPMLMGKLKEVKSDSYSREDGLRSFGQLLREGKLRKLKGGRFSVTDETEFRAETRNAS